MDLTTYPILFGAGLCAGFVDSVAGGGGLIALPALLTAGLPPQVALGTNKLQGSFGTFSSACNYIKRGTVDLKKSTAGVLFTIAGAASGAWAIQQLDPGFIRHLVPILLLAVFVYMLFSPEIGYEDGRERMPGFLFFLVFGLGLGFYDGFFGPGTGSFWMAAFVMVMGFNMTKAAGYTRVMNFTSNILALLLFVIGGNVLYSAGLCMGAGQVIGARIGSGMAIKRGAGFVRPVFLTVVFLTILRLVYVNYA
ncbi:MAG: TSUP family transporter [Desulfarculaceae bacterium]|nr:TSUP family transporter [Desulfarculaceae bacterium]